MSRRLANALPVVTLILLASPANAVWGDDIAGGVAIPSHTPKVSCATAFEGDLVVGGRFDEGVYLAQLTTDDGAQSRKLVLAK